jgi:hypothetical protein
MLLRFLPPNGVNTGGIIFAAEIRRSPAAKSKRNFFRLFRDLFFQNPVRKETARWGRKNAREK